MEATPQIVIGVPGAWVSRQEMMCRIAAESDGYLFAGDILKELGTRYGWELHWEPASPRIIPAFAIAGRGSLTPPDLDALQAHRSVAYLLGTGGSLEAAAGVLRAGAGLLRAGGIAVNVESTGRAHSRADWLALAADGGPVALYHAFVTLIGGEGEVRSCGMHNLGFPDAVVAGPADAGSARLLQTLQIYQLVERPDLQDGHTFSTGPDAPVYRLHREPCTLYRPDDLFHNPYGMWRLVPGSA